MTQDNSEFPKPYFVIESSNRPEDIDALQGLARDIDQDPVAVLHVAHTLVESPAGKESKYAHGVRVATSREVGLEFDDATEDAIAVSAIIKELRIKRREHQHNEDRSRQLAAEVRRTRLVLFIERAIDHGIQNTAEIIPMQPNQQGTHSGHTISA